MTEKLYYRDVHQTTFTATVIETTTTPRGTAVRLDRTAFYPTSGGQPHDTGYLNASAVLDVWQDEAGEIWHLLAEELTTATVAGAIDGERRRDHMQQHTGQHLLSAACLRLLQAPTIGFHLGVAGSTIDLDLPDLGWEAAFRVEDDVNRVIWENRPLEIQFVTETELDTLHLRRKPPITGPIRVVTVPDYDTTLCSGTHTTRTGEVGALKITDLSRYKGGTRVTFLCGQRALRDYRRALQLLQHTSRELTIGQDELPTAIAHLQTEAKETRRALSQTQTTLNQWEAERLWQAAPTGQGLKRIIRVWTDRPFDEVRAIASHLQQQPDTLILLATLTASGVRLVCARSADLDLDAARILRTALAPLSGRGGGTPTLAQGGAPAATPEAVLAALEQAVV